MITEMTEKGDLYIEVFNTISEVRRMVFQIAAELNILCRSVVKQCYAEIKIHCSRATTTYMCSHVPLFIKADCLPPSNLDLSPVDFSEGLFTCFATKTVSSRDPRHR